MHPSIKNAMTYLKTHFSKSLVAGLLVSVLLHLMLAMTLLERPSIDTRLASDSTVLIDAVLLQPSPPISAKPTLPRKADRPKLRASEKAHAMPAASLSDNAYRMTDAEETPTDAPPVMLNDELVSMNTQADAVPLADTGDTPLQANTNDDRVVINPDAYAYVETYFDVRTDMRATPQASPVGHAKIIFQLTQNNTHYQIDSYMAPRGFASLFIANLTQKSVGHLTAQGLQPLQYDYQFGDKADKTYRAQFDWEKQKLSMTTLKGTHVVNLTADAQDLLSFMYQLMYVPPLNNLQFNITNGKKFALYSYLFEGEEFVDTTMGTLNTVHIARENDDHDEKTDLWLATDYQYLPVKIRKTEKNGKVYELLATKILTKAP